MDPSNITVTLKIGGLGSTLVIYDTLSEIGKATANAKPMPLIQVTACEPRGHNYEITISARGSVREVFNVQADILELLQEHDRIFSFLDGSITAVHAIDDTRILSQDEIARELGLVGTDVLSGRRTQSDRPAGSSQPERPKTTGDTTPIQELGLRRQPLNILLRQDIRTIGELLVRTRYDLKCLPSFGLKSEEEVIDALAARDLKLWPEDDD